MVVVLIVLNIILIIVVIFLILFCLRKTKENVKNICANDKCNISERGKYKQNNKPKSERVFVGRFITDEEYQQMTKNQKSNVSNLIEEVNKEYEYLKKLSNE